MDNGLEVFLLRTLPRRKLTEASLREVRSLAAKAKLTCEEWKPPGIQLPADPTFIESHPKDADRFYLEASKQIYEVVTHGIFADARLVVDELLYGRLLNIRTFRGYLLVTCHLTHLRKPRTPAVWSSSTVAKEQVCGNGNAIQSYDALVDSRYYYLTNQANLVCANLRMNNQKPLINLVVRDQDIVVGAFTAVGNDELVVYYSELNKLAVWKYVKPKDAEVGTHHETRVLDIKLTEAEGNEEWTIIHLATTPDKQVVAVSWNPNSRPKIQYHLFTRRLRVKQCNHPAMNACPEMLRWLHDRMVVRNTRVVRIPLYHVSLLISVYRSSVVETLFICRGKFVPGPCLELSGDYLFSMAVMRRTLQRQNQPGTILEFILTGSESPKIYKITMKSWS